MPRMSREKQFNLRFSDEEMEVLRQLAEAQDRSINSYIRSLIRQAANKSVIELSPRKKVKQQIEEYA